jgi:dTDP-4-dehydrorhamnose reductase
MPEEGALLSVLVTGGSGYLGQHTVASLTQLPWVSQPVHYTWCSSSDGSPLRPGVAQAHRLQLGSASVEDVRQILRACRPDVIIHTAAMSGLGACEKEPQLAMRVNCVSAPVAAQHVCMYAGAARAHTTLAPAARLRNADMPPRLTAARGAAAGGAAGGARCAPHLHVH